MRRVLLISGGIDSTIMLFEAYLQGLKAELLYVKCGQKYEKQELFHINKLLQTYSLPYKLHVIDIKGISHKDNFIENRNLTLASIAVTSLKARYIQIAGLKDDNVVDKNDAAYKIMSDTFTLFSKRPITVYSPYSNITKGELVERFLRTFPNSAEVLQATYSCYSAKDKPCGKCPACFRKYVALVSNGIPAGFDIDFSIVSKYLENLHEYDHDRVTRTLIALRKSFGPIHCIDIDGTLCELGKERSYRNKLPISENVAKVKALTGIKVLYTSRLDSDRQATIEWLNEQGIHYHSLLLKKPYYDFMYDDKANVL
jgi:7-cyano-7-deazaguanine synthase in queuosine biosynthesis